MKKVLALIFILVLIPLGALAGIKIGLVGGYALPSDGNYKGGVAIGGILSYDIMKYLTLEVRAVRSQFTIAGSTDGLSDGALSVFPIMVAAQFRYPLNERFAPYLVVGGGFSMNSFTIDSSVTDSWSAVGLTVEESVKGGAAFQAGAGLDVTLAPKVNLGLDFRYVLAKADGEWSMADSASEESVSGALSGLSLNHMVIGLSLKYAF